MANRLILSITCLVVEALLFLNFIGFASLEYHYVYLAVPPSKVSPKLLGFVIKNLYLGEISAFISMERFSFISSEGRFPVVAPPGTLILCAPPRMAEEVTNLGFPCISILSRASAEVMVLRPPKIAFYGRYIDPTLARTLRKLCFEVYEVKARDVLAGKLPEYDVFIFSPGSARAFKREIGKEGLLKIKGFMRGSGGVVGICAGGYVLADMFGVKVRNMPKWATGRGTVVVSPTPEGKRILGVLENTPAFYFNGPIFEASPEIIPLLEFTGLVRTDFITGPDYQDVSQVEWLVLCGRRGKPGVASFLVRYFSGKAIAFSFHPEIKYPRNVYMLFCAIFAVSPKTDSEVITVGGSGKSER